ncbi:transcriptional regulator, DeoR family [Clostridium sp. USBA 49]|uniref:DeoR/GlpR family DNA-binding transcription regulator n=1 Tax=Clostridium sp. USBA 49 TaxID=1881060 RepID=UPI00099ABDEB|nr:DeoR/GlpR family DNA-binding transcription regulator [Clostridium sp. USBA 49]SKA87746.1 transcriptional regulator, DeoR family [Clostridium sp. USBA 49]
MFAFERHDKIMDLLNKKKQVTVLELSELLNVSVSTIRNDLTKLEKDGFLTKTHGGAVLQKDDDKYIAFTERMTKHIKEKEAIANEAVTLINDDQSIILDASSTSLALAKKLHNFKRLTVITNGLYTALELKDNPNIKVILTGGLVTPGSFSLEGLLGENLVKSIHADLCFMSAKGFTIKEGLTDFNIYEAELKKMLAKKSNKLIALLDHSKLDMISIASFSPASDIYKLITDEKAPKQLIEKYKSSNINISVASLK